MLRSSLFTSLIVASLFLFGLHSSVRGIVSLAENEVAIVDTRFWVFLQDNNSDPFDGVEADIQGYEWPDDKAITLTIDRPSTPLSPDYTFSPSQIEEDGEGYIHVYFPNVTLYPDDIITMTNGETTLIHTLTALAVTEVDRSAATVSGTAAPGSLVRVVVQNDTTFPTRVETTAGDGSWSADFSVPGDEAGEEETIAFTPGMYIWVIQENGQTQQYHPYIPNPSFYVFLLDNNHDPNDGLITDPQGYEWPADLPVTLTIDLPGTPETPDYTLSPSSSEPMQPGGLHHYFNTFGISVHPGDIVSLTNGETTFTDTIHAFAVTALDADTDTISGIAPPGTTVQVSFRQPWNERHATANTSGIWTEDFSEPGLNPGESATSDLLPGSPFFVSQGLNTYDVRVPNPHIEANFTSNWIKARELPLGASVTLLIDDPATPAPVDYSAAATVADDQNTWEWHMTGAVFVPVGFDLQSGHVVSILYNSKVRSLTVQPIQVTGFDFEGDMISGEGVAGHTLQVCVYENDNPCRTVPVGGDGSWTANFHIAGPTPGEEDTHDIQPGTSGRVTDQEADGDQSIVSWVATLKIYLPVVIKN